MNIVPRNPRKEDHRGDVDAKTGRRLVEPEQFRQQFQQWLQSQSNQPATPSVMAERRIRNFVSYLFETLDLN